METQTKSYEDLAAAEKAIDSFLASSPPSARARRRRWARRRVLGVVAVALVGLGIGAAAFVFLNRGDGGSKSGAAANQTATAPGFRLDYPTTWRPLSRDELEALPGRPLAVLRRKDGSGFLVVTREPGRLQKSFGQTATDLTRQLKSRMPDFAGRSSKTVDIRAGKALFVSFIREKTGTVHTVVVVPARSSTFTLNSVSRGGANGAAREVAQMILSFDT